MEPCSEKENIKKLFDFHEEKMNQLHEMEKRQIQIQGDVAHVKSRIDNGMSHTISDMSDSVKNLIPIITHHAEVIKKIEGMGWTLATSLLISILGLLAWGISKGFSIKL